MNVNQKGVKGLIKVIDQLSTEGYYCFPAFDDHSPVDIVAMDLTGNIFRLQVKYREKKKGSYSISTDSIVNGKRIPINRNLIDGWALYMANDDKVVFISKEKFSNQTTLNIKPEFNGRLCEWLKQEIC